MNKINEALKFIKWQKSFMPTKQHENMDLAIETLEKQIPKKPILYGDSEDGKLLCPSCGEDLWDVKECGYSGCPYCLQAIDWSVEE